MLYLFAALALLAVGLVYWWGRSQPPGPPALPDGLRMATRAFELVVNQDAETITVRAPQATHKTPTSQGVAERRPVDLTLPAAGFSVVVTRDTRPVHGTNRRRAERTPDVYTRHVRHPLPERPQALPLHEEETGTSTVVFLSRRHPLAEAGSELAAAVDVIEVRQVPNDDLAHFRTRFREVETWIDGMEVALRDRVQAHAKARQIAQHKAEQALARLSADCGFQPIHSAMDFDVDGNLLWAIKTGDVDRCWIHADGKTYLGTMAGGRATPLQDCLEVMVRDRKWENSYFSRRKMKLFLGADQPTLAEWSTRLNALAGWAPR